MPKDQHQYERPAPNESGHLKGSQHSGVSPNRSDVRIRHPEVGKHVAPGAGGGEFKDMLGGPNDNPCEPCGPTADTTDYPLDLFNRVLVGNTHSAGDALGSPTFWNSYITDSSSFVMTQDTTPPYLNFVRSTLGTAAYAWTSPLNTCCCFAFTFTGWEERAVWLKYTVPAWPADAAGITIDTWALTGEYGWAGGTVTPDNGANLIVSSHEPTYTRDGTFIAHMPYGVYQNMFIPASLIPAEGGELWVGVVPAWQADLGDYTCSFRWPWMDGKGNSGRGYTNNLNDVNASWHIWDITGDEWGSGLTSDETGAWWDGDLPWSISTSGGSFGMDGESLYLNVPAGTTETLVARMDGLSKYSLDDDADYVAKGEPWTDEKGVRMRARFRITTAGSLTEAGTRFLSFEWHSGRGVYKGTVWLGDTLHNEGLTVAAEGVSAAIDKAISEGSWMWVSLDARNPEYFRGKLWVEQAVMASGEPPIYDIQVDTSPESESPTTDDYFEIIMSAGNATGADQKIEVFGVWFAGAAAAYQWVNERIGQGDGYASTFATSQPWQPGGLWFFVDGLYARALTSDLVASTFQSVDGYPADEHAILVARYRANLNPDGD